MGTAGLSVPVVIPLPEDVVVTAQARYLKFVEGVGWQNFVEDERNQLHSASRDAAGECPMPGDTRYNPGLITGATCVQLIIEDGGPNDASGSANGLIRDPGALYLRVGNGG